MTPHDVGQHRVLKEPAKAIHKPTGDSNQQDPIGAAWHASGASYPRDAEPRVVWAYGEGTVAASIHGKTWVLRQHMQSLGLEACERENGLFYIGRLTPYELGLVTDEVGPFMFEGF